MLPEIEINTLNTPYLYVGERGSIFSERIAIKFEHQTVKHSKLQCEQLIIQCRNVSSNGNKFAKHALSLRERKRLNMF